ncbi:hypothetical protein A5768_26435 [Mycolicibacterium fortuitum]|uniref:hypothetical protein n=1 Tax=Mycolicibacterium fortuitum TaxID=1766 RepID=UPI0007EA1FB0|nr:hypothetical protein [Mycolicibacterium fortuitum]OBG21640.1 hypothetical protein A5768_26435 [Mycolicibacterium fortuitum]
MTDVVAITTNGSIIKGSYDGYGNIDQFEGAIIEATVWHHACWKASGQPTAYQGPSAAAPDQGWFFEDPAHDLAEPLPPANCADRTPERLDPPARQAGLEVMGSAGILGILWNRETVNTDTLLSLTPDHITALYNTHIGPAIDDVERQLNTEPLR